MRPLLALLAALCPIVAGCSTGDATLNTYGAHPSGGAGGGSDGSGGASAPVSSTAASATVSTTAGAGGAGGSPQPPECVAPADCPGVDNACRARTCAAGKCGVDLTSAGPLPTGQTVGDCSALTCDGAGALSSAPDPSDVPADDGNPCTSETCDPSPTHAPVAEGSLCGGSGNLCDATAQCVSKIPIVCNVPGAGVYTCSGFGTKMIWYAAGPSMVPCYPNDDPATMYCGAQGGAACWCAPGTACSVGGKAGVCQ